MSVDPEPIVVRGKNNEVIGQVVEWRFDVPTQMMWCRAILDDGTEFTCSVPV